jgi:hypothetical protein
MVLKSVYMPLLYSVIARSTTHFSGMSAQVGDIQTLGQVIFDIIIAEFLVDITDKTKFTNSIVWTPLKALGGITADVLSCSNDSSNSRAEKRDGVLIFSDTIWISVN